MKKTYLLIIFISIFFNGFSQKNEIDSLKKIIKSTSSQELKLSELEHLNKILISKSSLKSSLPYFLEMAQIADELKNDELKTRAYKYISETYMKEMDSTNAFLFAKKALLINKKNNNLNGYLIDINQLGRAYHHFQLYEQAIAAYKQGIKKYYEKEDETCLVSLAMIYSNASASYDKLGKVDESIDAILKGVKIAEKTNSANQKSYALYALAYKYMGLKNYEKAEEYFFKSLKFSDSVSLQTYVNMNHHGLGINYSRLGNYKKALYHNKIALDFFRKQGSRLFEFDVLNNTAVVYQRMNKSDSVIFYGKLALKVANEINHKSAITGAKLTLSRAYLNKGKYNKAEEILHEVAKDTINPKVIDLKLKASIYLSFSEVYEIKHNYRKSLEYHKIFKKINDSIEKENLESKFSDIETKYQTEKKEKQLAEQKLATQEQELLTQKANTRNWLLAIGLLALSISAFFIWRRYKSEAKAKQIISEQKTQIEKLQKEFHHRLKNDFRSINSYIGLVQRQFTDTNFKERLNELKNRVTSMFKVHEILLQEDDITQVKAHPYLLELSQNVGDKYRNKNIKVTCNVDTTETIVADKAVPFGIVLNEFITNSYKYAFDDKGGEIHIDFKSDTDNHYLTLKDNGKGLPDDFDIERLRSLGMSIIPMFADLHDGSYQLDGSNGVSLTLTLPKKVA